MRANDKGIRQKAGSFLLFAGWLAAAFVIVSAQLDRESRYQPDLADYVPPHFRSFSQAIIVKRLLHDETDADRSYAEASTLLLRRPIPAENLSLYGLAAARAGKDDQSRQAIGLAAARGWHDEVSQYAALDAAMAAGEWPSASLRLQALMQVQLGPAILGRAVQGFLTNKHGRAALASLIVKNPSFQYRILSIAGAYGAENGIFPRLVDALKPYKRRIDCGSLRTLVVRWLAHGEAGLALDAWTGLCARDETSRGKDLAFSTHYGDSDPFAWQIPDQPAISWFIDPASGTLSYSNDENLGRLLAWHMLTLAPGLHRLKMEGRPVVKNGNYPLLRLKCLPSGKSVKMESSPDNLGMLTILVPEGCPVQKLQVKVLRGNFLGFRLTEL